MWYFAWILGVSLACALAIINALWLEINDDSDHLNGEIKPTQKMPLN